MLLSLDQEKPKTRQLLAATIERYWRSLQDGKLFEEWQVHW